MSVNSSAIDDQIIATANLLGLGDHPLNAADTEYIWEAHKSVDIVAMCDPNNRLSIAVTYDFTNYSVSAEGYRKPLSSILNVSLLK